MDVESVAAAVTALTFTGEYDGIVDDGEDENAPFHAVRLRVMAADFYRACSMHLRIYIFIAKMSHCGPCVRSPQRRARRSRPDPSAASLLRAGLQTDAPVRARRLPLPSPA